MVAGHDDHGAIRPGRRQAERVPLTLDDEGRNRHVVELVEPALDGLAGRASGWLEWECKAEHRDRSDDVGRPAGDPRAGRSSADDQRKRVKVVVCQVVDDRDPRRIQLVPRRGGPAAGKAVRLQDEGDAHTAGER